MICTKCTNHWIVDEGKPLGNCPTCGADTLLMLNAQLANPQVEAILQNMIIVNGVELLNDQRRLSAMIGDLFHENNRVMRLLQLGAKNHIPLTLAGIYKERPADFSIKISAFRKQVQEMTFLKDEALNELFQYWIRAINPPKSLSTNSEPEDGVWIDEFGVKYSIDGRKLIKATQNIVSYSILFGTEVICDGAFFNCNTLSAITIPNSVNKIGERVFNMCIGLTSIQIPSSVNSIGNLAFCGCVKLNSFSIPSSVTLIGKSVFYSCTGLTSVTIPPSITSIGDSAFAGCSRLTSIVIPDSVTTIGSSAFHSCLTLKSIVIPSSVISIGESAFCWCTHLSSISISSSLKTIEKSAFAMCGSLRSIDLPDSITSIGDGAFDFSSSLNQIVIRKENFKLGERLSELGYQDKIIAI